MGQQTASSSTYAVYPTLTGINPSSGPSGAVVTLTGTAFSTVAGQTTFYFFGLGVPGNCSSTTQCTATVPAATGKLKITEVTVSVKGLSGLSGVEFSETD